MLNDNISAILKQY